MLFPPLARRTHASAPLPRPFHRLVPSVLVTSACLAAATTLAGCGTDLTQVREAVEEAMDAATAGATPPPTALPLLDATQASARLATLPRAERRPVGLPDYRRDAFGAAWSDVDGNGCNQRDDVLLRDALPGTAVTAPQGRCPHDVLAGTWIDPYSGVQVQLDDLKERSQAQAVQIDHVVPLAEAWRSGASSWTPERRHRFANDLSVLVASDGPTNASKADHDPAAWRPRRAHQCTYALRWVDVKHAWSLAVDASEARALTEMLDLCD